MGGDVIHNTFSANCIWLDEASNNHQRGSDNNRSATVTPNATIRTLVSLTKNSAAAPASGRKISNVSQGNPPDCIRPQNTKKTVTRITMPSAIASA